MTEVDRAIAAYRAEQREDRTGTVVLLVAVGFLVVVWAVPLALMMVGS